VNLLLYLLVYAIRLFLTIEQVLFLARAILSWIFLTEDSKIMNFLYRVTEPLIIPARILLGRIEGINEMPIDIPFFATVILLPIVQMLLPTIYL
jgi:YggT family protein